MKRMQGMLFALVLLAASAAWAVPTVTGVNPPDGGTAQPSTTVTATFSEAMDPATLTTESFTLRRFAGSKSISTGFDTNLVVTGGGTAVGWGLNNYGQADVPVELTGVVTAVASGWWHSVVLKNDGSLFAWGHPGYDKTTVPAGNDFVAISAGQDHNLALKGDGTVVAWGTWQYGANTVPEGLSGVIAIAAGGWHNLALKDDGTVVAWGDSENGQINVPADLSNVVAIAAGQYHSLALKSDGTVVAWGDPYRGAISVPVDLSGVVAIAAGYSNSMALLSDGTVVAWGWNNYGQSSIPTDLSGVVAIDAGVYHSIALKNDGTMVAWGYNNNGQTSVPAGLSGVGFVSVEGTVTYDPATYIAAFTPLVFLAPETTYLATVNTGARNTLGEHLAAEVPWNFTVAYPPLVFETTTLPDGVEFDPYSQTLAATGGDGSYFWEITAGTLPDGLGLNQNSGEISGTPTTGGTYPFTIQVTSGDGQTATQNISITIGYPPLVIQTTSLLNGFKHTPYSETLTATGGNTPLSWLISDWGTLPQAEWNLSQDGVLSSTRPSKGTYTFTVQVTTADPDTQAPVTQVLSITIDNN